MTINLLSRQKRDGVSVTSWDSLKQRMDFKEDEERGKEYLKRLEEEEALDMRMKLEEENVSEADDDDDAEDDWDIPEELLEEFCNEENEDNQEETNQAKPKRNYMKIPNLTLMILKNNTSDQEAADNATGKVSLTFNKGKISPSGAQGVCMSVLLSVWHKFV